MHVQPTTSPMDLKMLQGALESPLKAGELGVLIAPAGVGKTACLTHIAIEALIGGEPVLHVCIDGVPDRIRAWYHEILKSLTSNMPREEATDVERRVEPLRFILAYVHQTFSIEKLEQSLGNLRTQAQFNPALMVVDGLDFDRIDRGLIEGLKAFAARNEMVVWVSARMHRHITQSNDRGIPYPCHELDDLFQTIVQLEPLQDSIGVKILKSGGQYGAHPAGITLDPQTYLLR